MSAIEQWMTSNRLKLNADKTQFMWLGTKRAATKVESRCKTVKIGDTDIPFLYRSHLPWSRFRPTADFLRTYSSTVGKLYLPSAPTTCGPKNAY